MVRGVAALALFLALSIPPARSSLASTPPDVLLAAARAYFTGNYARVEELLGRASLGDSRAQAHARLLLAASRYAQYVLGGQKNTRLRDLAIADIREVRKLDSKVVPSPRYFSPKFIAFFRDIR